MYTYTVDSSGQLSYVTHDPDQVVPDVSGDVEDESLYVFGRFRISQNLTVIHTLEDMMVNLKKRN